MSLDSPTGRADLHLHTTASDGLVSPSELLAAVEATSLDVIAVTDHDTIAGAQLTKRLSQERGSRIEVIVGIEVTTSRARHLLGLFVERPIAMHRSIEWTLAAIADQGGIALAPHPLSPLTPSLGYRTISHLVEAGLPLHGVETANPTPAGKIVRRKVARCNQRWQLAEFGGSDAHFLPHIGSGFTLFHGSTADDLRRSILERTTQGRLTTEPIGTVPPFDYLRQVNKSMVQSPARKLGRALGLLPHEPVPAA